MPPKKSSKKKSGSKQQAAAQTTTLVPHTAPELGNLLERAKRGKRNDVQQYLSAGGSPHVIVPVQLPYAVQAPLICSVATNAHREVPDSISLLLEAGADPNAATPTSGGGGVERTALMMSCFPPGQVKSVQVLLDAGADCCYRSRNDGTTALHIAAMAGQLEHCRLLVAASAGRILEHEIMHDGGTALYMAATVHKDTAVVEALHSLGASLHCCDVIGHKPLQVAAGTNNTALIRYLLQQSGIDVNESCGEDCETALYVAAVHGNLAAAKLLLQHGGDVYAKNSTGMTPLYAAAANEHTPVVKLLLEAGSNVHAELAAAHHGGGHSSLIEACASGYAEIAELLIKGGASVH
jgi:ankyrin repeat protein